MAQQEIDSTQIMNFVLKVFVWEQKDTSIPPILWKEIGTYQPLLHLQYKNLAPNYSEEIMKGIKSNYCLIYSYFYQTYPGIIHQLDQNRYGSTYAKNLAFISYLLKEDTKKAFLLAYDSLDRPSESMHLLFFLYKRIKKREPFKYLNHGQKVQLLCDHFSLMQEFENICEQRYWS